MGTWFEIQRDKKIWYEEPGETECVTATYTWNAWNFLYPVGVNNRAHKQSSDTLTTTTAMNDESESEWNFEYARARCSWGNGDCNVKFWWYPEGNYQILDTDYDNYAVLYGCDDWWFGLMHSRNSWLLNRERNSANQATYKQTAIDVLAERVPDYPWTDRIHNTKHDGDCRYAPKIQAIIDADEAA